MPDGGPVFLRSTCPTDGALWLGRARRDGAAAPARFFLPVCDVVCRPAALPHPALAVLDGSFAARAGEKRRRFVLRFPPETGRGTPHVKRGLRERRLQRTRLSRWFQSKPPNFCFSASPCLGGHSAPQRRRGAEFAASACAGSRAWFAVLGAPKLEIPREIRGQITPPSVRLGRAALLEVGPAFSRACARARGF